MRSSLKIILKYLLFWLILSTSYFFLSEEITKRLFKGFHDVGLWLIIVAIGISVIFIVLLTFFIIELKKKENLELFKILPSNISS
jgi:hypothetical protein